LDGKPSDLAGVRLRNLIGQAILWRMSANSAETPPALAKCCRLAISCANIGRLFTFVKLLLSAEAQARFPA
jgi:hypothetical protein